MTDNANAATDKEQAGQLLGQLISYAHSMGATDMHVSPGMVPDVVVRGQLYALSDAPLVTEEIVWAWARTASPLAQDALQGPYGAADGAMTVGPVRVRCAFRRQEGGLAMTARLLPLEPPRLGDLDVPDSVAALIFRPNGLVIVSGPTGAGKSTLLAALVNEVNQTQSRHVMTIEEPIEFVHPQSQSRISQREVGRHVDTFDSALRAAVRARPDLIVVGEMRDMATARAALDAASKGQLVLTTSHASSASDALQGLVGLFPAAEQASVASRLASLVQGVVAQQLVPSTDGTQVVAVREILMRNPAVTNLIREGKFALLYNALAGADAADCLQLERDLRDKVAQGRISKLTAFAVANERTNLTQLLGGAR